MAAKKFSPKQPLHLFSLYAPEDRRLYEKFERHLSSLQRQGLITSESVESIIPGTNQQEAINKALLDAHIILCFLSADFLNSSYCQVIEQFLGERQAASHKSVVPIFLREIDIEDLHLGKLRALPDGHPVNARKNKDRVFVDIVKELRRIAAAQMPSSAEEFTATDNYLDWLIQHLSFLEVQGIRLHSRASQIHLAEVFIPRSVVEKVEPSPAAPHNGAEYTHEAAPLAFSEAVLHHKHLLLLGEPGSGKTLCLQDLTYRQAKQFRQQSEVPDDKTWLPFLLRLTDFVEHGIHRGKSLGEYLAEDASKHGCLVTHLGKVLRTALQTGNCLVLLDGLDEVVDTDDYLAVVQHINMCVAQYSTSSNHFVVTSRPFIDATVPFNKLFATYHLCALDEAHQQAFLQAWYPVLQAALPTDQITSKKSDLETQTCEKLQEALHTTAALQHFATNPLFLRILIQLYQVNGAFPQQRAALYAQLVRTLLQRERLLSTPSRGELASIFEQLSQPSIALLLSRLGFWLHSNRTGGTIREDEIFEVWSNIWPTLTNQQRLEEAPLAEQAMRDLLRVVMDHTALLVAETPGHYRFTHFSFEEYFAACALVTETTERVPFFRNHLHKTHWQEPILLALGLIGMEDPEETHQIVESLLHSKRKQAGTQSAPPGHYEHLLGQDFLFALRCLGDNIPVHSALAEHLIERLYRELAHRDGSGKFMLYHLALAERLRCLETSGVAPLLLALYLKELEQSNALHFWLVYRLRDIGHSSLLEKEPICQRLRALLSDNDPSIRSACLQSLYDLDDPDLIDILLDRLQNDTDRSVQREALHYLSEKRVPSAFMEKVLLHVLSQTTSDPHNIQLHWRVVEALGQLETPTLAGISALIVLMKANMTLSIDTHVLESLRQLSYRSAEVIPMLVSALQDAPQEVHLMLVREIATFNQSTQQAKEAFLLYTTQFWKYPWGRFDTRDWEQLEEISEQTEKALQAHLFTEEKNVRELAAKILCKFELSEKTFSILSDILLFDTDVSLRTHIMGCLVDTDWSDKELSRIFFQTMHDPNDTIRVCAIECLKKLAPPSPQVLNALLLALDQDPSQNVRWSVIRYFSEWDKLPAKVLPFLLQAFANEDGYIRYDCARLLGQCSSGGKQTIRALIMGLSDTDHLVRQTCSQSLVLLGQRVPQRRPAIMKHLAQYIQSQSDDTILYLRPADMAFDALWLLSNEKSCD